jgi:hypothetical protein
VSYEFCTHTKQKKLNQIIGDNVIFPRSMREKEREHFLQVKDNKKAGFVA